MQRPVMNPNFRLESPSSGPARKPRFQWLRKIFGFFLRLLMASPFGKPKQFRNEEGTRLSRFVRGLTYRLAFVPILLVGFLSALIFGATHPGRNPAASEPPNVGVYYDPVSFVADDGARLEGWLVPVIDAKKVIAERENALGKRYPAVVLVHEFAATRDQLVHLAEPLHRSGFVVLLMNLRGASASSTDAQTFGIREAMDVKAAVEMLRRRPYVDPTRIALVGIGTGANASMIAARDDVALTTLVLAAPVEGFDKALAARLGEDQRWLPAMQSLLRWTFQVMYGLETTELDLKNYSKMLATRNVHMTDGRTGLLEQNSIAGVQRFLIKNLNPQVASTPTGH
jgi:pimeloyl-ACP methyl ester carboxylesterase